MCGICGIALSSRSSLTIDRRTIERMRDVITHRGPDDAGEFIEAGIGLGHRRLSIVDVSRGHQPMASEDGELQLVYNGEVYNHPQVSAELMAAGVRYRTHCDTETVLHVFAREGMKTPERLRGMFAFAIWNRRTRELFLTRDRLGVKPLYYAITDDGSIYFASEIKSLFASGVIQPRLATSVLPDYLANHAPSGETTLFVGVKRLLPGHSLLWRDGVVRIERYWDLEMPPANESDQRRDEDMVAEYREMLREAVRMRLMADVPLGSFLSGGIDSAAITALMSDLVGGGVKTFSVAFRDREANELEYARIVANHFRTDHHEVVVSPTEFFLALPRMVWHEDEPIAHPSSIPLYFVSRLAVEHVKVVLTGEGSDETLGGYGRYRTTLQNLTLGKAWEGVGGARLRGATRRVIDELPAQMRLRHRLERTFLYEPADIASLYFDAFAVFSRRDQASLLSGDLRASLGVVDPYAVNMRYVGANPASSLLNQLLYVDTKTYLHELLMKQDQMSMAASIESRVPFLDHPLIEFAARLPDRMKLRGGTTKFVLRRAMQGILPSAILERPKMGFPVPIGSWFRSEFRSVIEEFVLGARAKDRGLFDESVVQQFVAEHVHGVRNHAQRLWSLLVLELWQRIFLDGESVDDVCVEMKQVIGRRPGSRTPPAPMRRRPSSHILTRSS